MAENLYKSNLIIDMHTHIGSALNFHIPGEMLLEAMDKYKIDYALVSSSECIEADHSGTILPPDKQISQIDANQRILDFAKNHKTRIGVLLWGKPHTEQCDEQFEQLLIEDREMIYGIKIHPFHSAIPFHHPNVQRYICLAQKYHLPVLTHTAPDRNCSAKLVYQMALKYPNVNFIMGHMELGTDNKRAMKYIAQRPNLYGDTAWVYPENAVRMVAICGAKKLLFGTDAPIDGVDTYAHPDFYKKYLGSFRSMVGETNYNKIMWENAVRLFGIKRS